MYLAVTYLALSPRIMPEMNLRPYVLCEKKLKVRQPGGKMFDDVFSRFDYELFTTNETRIYRYYGIQHVRIQFTAR